MCFRIDWLDLLAVQGDSDEFCPGGTRWQEELVDVLENIFLHGYIRNTPSDTEVHAEYQLSGQEYMTSRKEYIDPRKIQGQALSL